LRGWWGARRYWLLEDARLAQRLTDGGKSYATKVPKQPCVSPECDALHQQLSSTVSPFPSALNLKLLRISPSAESSYAKLAIPTFGIDQDLETQADTRGPVFHHETNAGRGLRSQIVVLATSGL